MFSSLVGASFIQVLPGSWWSPSFRCWSAYASCAVSLCLQAYVAIPLQSKALPSIYHLRYIKIIIVYLPQLFITSLRYWYLETILYLLVLYPRYSRYLLADVFYRSQRPYKMLLAIDFRSNIKQFFFFICLVFHRDLERGNNVDVSFEYILGLMEMNKPGLLLYILLWYCLLYFLYIYFIENIYQHNP